MNNRDAFSHSQQCDQFFSGPVITHPGTGCLVPGFEQAHDKCRCWCHSALDLFSSPEPEYDLTPPPEYLSSADRAFALDEPAHVRVGFSEFTASLDVHQETEAVTPLFETAAINTGGAVVLDSRLNEIAARPGIDIHEGPANKAGFSKWSAKELASGKCDTCGDKLADCECVE